MKNVVFALISLILTIPCYPAAGRSAWFEPAECVRYNSELQRHEVSEGARVRIDVVSDITVVGVDIGAITVENTDSSVPNQGVGALGALNTKLTYGPLANPGLYKDGTRSNVVIFQISGSVGLDDPDTGVNESVPTDPGEVLYSFEVQAGAEGTTITIDDLIGPPPANPYGPYPLSTTLTSESGAGNYDITQLEVSVVAAEPSTLSQLDIIGPDQVWTGILEQYRARVYYYADCSSIDVTDLVSWRVEPEDIADIDANGMLSVADGVGPGTITIYAEYSPAGVSLSAEKVVEVIGLRNIAITGPGEVFENTLAKYEATGYWSDRQETNLTAAVDWQVQPAGIAEIDDNGVLTVGDIDADTSITISGRLDAEGLESQMGVLLLATRMFGVPTDFPTIQGAIDFAGDGDIVEIQPGTYMGQGNRDIDFKGKAVTVRSTDPYDFAVVTSTIIDCQGKEYDPHRGFYFHSGEDERAVLTGVVITNGYASGQSPESCGGAIFCNGSSPTITNCIILGNSASYRGGGICCYSGGMKIANCVLTENFAQYGGGAIYNRGNTSITSCSIYGNSLSSNGHGGGVLSYTHSGDEPIRVRNSILWGNTDHRGSQQFAQIDASYAEVNYCCVQELDGSLGGEGNIGLDPSFAPGGYHLSGDSPCIDAGDPLPNYVNPYDIDGDRRVMGGRVDIGPDEFDAEASVIGVRPNRFDFQTPAAGVNPQPQNLSIENRGLIALNWRIELDCSWLNVSVSSGQSMDEVNELAVSVNTSGLEVGTYHGTIRAIDEAASNSPKVIPVTLVVTDNDALLNVPSEYDTIQSAINLATDGETVVVAEGVYTGDGNRDIDFFGKAITVRSTDPNDPDVVAATVIDCQAARYEHHRAFDFRNYESAASVLNGLTIINGNAEKGGAVYCFRSSPKIANCVLSANRASEEGGAFYCDLSNPRIINCRITANVADSDGGGMYCSQSNPILSGCEFVGNTALNDDGGGIYCYGSSPILSNCTITANSAWHQGGGISCDNESAPRIGSCIIWANRFLRHSRVDSAAQIYGGTPEVTFSCIHDGRPENPTTPFGGAANGNTGMDPLFVHDPNDGGDGWGDDRGTADIDEGANDDFGDMHLQQDSPCIEAGFPALHVSGDSVDMDGEPRIMGRRVDIGADEFAISMIAVTRPRPGEVWAGPSNHKTVWETYNYEGTVDILLSTDGGENWANITIDQPDTGSYLWGLPDTIDSNQCIVSVVPSVADANVTAAESGLFTIHPDSPGAAVSAKWKSLGGDFDRTGLSEGSGPELGCVKWRFETDAPIAVSVTAGSGDRLHLACEDGKLYTLDAENGELIWSFDVNSPLLSAPTVGLDGTLYVGSRDKKLYAVDLDGRLRWTHTTDGFIYSSPAVSAEGDVYVGSQDGMLYALGHDGSELWSFETKGHGAVATGSILASPTIGADGSIYVGGLYDPNLYALRPADGSVKWMCNFEFPDPCAPNGTILGWPFASSVVSEDGTIYQTLLHDTKLYAIEPANGTIIWATDLAEASSGWFDADYGEDYPFAEGWSEPALGPDGTIYVSFDDPYLRAVNPDGTIKWVTQLGVVGGFTLTVGGDGLVYAAADDGYLSVVNPQGREIARFRTDGWPNFPVISAENTIVLSDAKDETMLINNAGNTVWAVSADACDAQPLDLHRPGDLDADRLVDFIDLGILAEHWLACTDQENRPPCIYAGGLLYSDADIDRNLYVDFADFAALAKQWLSED